MPRSQRSLHIACDCPPGIEHMSIAHKSDSALAGGGMLNHYSGTRACFCMVDIGGLFWGGGVPAFIDGCKPVFSSFGNMARC